MKNLLQELNSMNILDLRYISKELGVSSKGGKKNIVNRLLQPLNRKYRMENVTLEKISFDNLKEDKSYLFYTTNDGNFQGKVTYINRLNDPGIDNNNIVNTEFIVVRIPDQNQPVRLRRIDINKIFILKFGNVSEDLEKKIKEYLII